LKVDNRDEFVKMMNNRGFMASEIHKRNDWHTYLNDYPIQLPNLDKFYSRLVHIPCGWWVTIEDCDKMIESIKQGWL
jgi:dTDP-4-amino-4,6-dideoxygalactose transaminase